MAVATSVVKAEPTSGGTTSPSSPAIHTTITVTAEASPTIAVVTVPVDVHAASFQWRSSERSTFSVARTISRRRASTLAFSQRRSSASADDDVKAVQMILRGRRGSMSPNGVPSSRDRAGRLSPDGAAPLQPSHNSVRGVTRLSRSRA
jgi:hypothetical protein